MSFLRSLGGAFGVASAGCVMHYVFNSIVRMERAAEVGIHLAEALRPAIAASFALGAGMMLLALITIVVKLPSPSRD